MSRILIIPASALFFVTFAFALVAVGAAFFLVILSAIAWKPYGARGGRLPGPLTGVAAKLGAITSPRR
jgi:Na+(H+)/acetate symporter ActP